MFVCLFGFFVCLIVFVVVVVVVEVLCCNYCIELKKLKKKNLSCNFPNVCMFTLVLKPLCKARG